VYFGEEDEWTYIGTNGCCACPDVPDTSGGSGEPTTVLFGGCSYPFPTTIYGTFAAGTPSPACDCFGGSFPMAWNGLDRWVGTYTTCAAVITVSWIIDSTTTPTMWTLTITSPGSTFTFAPDTFSFACAAIATSAGTILTGGTLGSCSTSITLSE
jgi:hypothetical protein